MNYEHKEVLYDPSLTYEQNYKMGPFCGNHEMSIPRRTGPRIDFLGYEIDAPLGVPAGPLLSGRHILAAWQWGFPVAVIKTVRDVEYPCHEFPNVVRVRTTNPIIKPGEILVGDHDVMNIDITVDGFTNSFGVPSPRPEVWQKDVRKSIDICPEGCLLVLSFMGTKQEGMSADQFVESYAKAAEITRLTRAAVKEINLSCPNLTSGGLVCTDINLSAKILEATRVRLGNDPLIVKIGYFSDGEQEGLEDLLELVYQYASGVSVVNALKGVVVDENGKQFLPGNKSRLVSGICGAKIKWAGLEMVERVAEIRNTRGWKDFKIVGVGGVTSPQDFDEYRLRGADVVMSATAAMLRPKLGLEIRKHIEEQRGRRIFVTPEKYSPVPLLLN